MQRSFLMDIMAIIGMIIIWHKTNGIGWLSYLISILGGCIITLLPVVIIGGNSLKTEKTQINDTNSVKDESGDIPKVESKEKSESLQ